MPWDNPEWDTGTFIFSLAFWLGAMLCTWCMQNMILKRETGAEQANEIRHSKTWIQKLFHLGYSEYIRQHPVSFFILQVKFVLMLLILLIIPMECIRYFEAATNVAFFGACFSFGIDMLIEECLGESRLDISGEPKEIADARVELIQAWKDLREEKKNWSKEKENPERKKRLKAINKIEAACWITEMSIRDFYQYVDVINTKEKQDRREKDIQELYDIFCEVQCLFESEGKANYNVFDNSGLFLSVSVYHEKYEKQKKVLEQAASEEKQKQLKELADVVYLFEDAVADRYVANQNIGRNNRSDYDEAVEMILAMADEIELLQKDLKHPKLDELITDLYDTMQVNGLLPEERKKRFPERMREGEIHRIYEYDNC